MPKRRVKSLIDRDITIYEEVNPIVLEIHETMDKRGRLEEKITRIARKYNMHPKSIIRIHKQQTANFGS